MNRIILVATMIIVINVCSFGQITITYADYQSMVRSRLITTTFKSTDTSGLRAIIEQSGSNRIWDIRGRTYSRGSTSETIYLTYPGGAPYANDPAFLSSNIVSRNTPILINDTSWHFNKLDSTGIYFYGQVYMSESLKYKETFSPSEHMPFPVTFNTSWIDRINHVLTFGNGDTSANNFIINSYYVDGYGTIITPEGSFPCLRLRMITKGYKNSSDTTNPFATYYGYMFIDEKKPYASIQTDDNGVLEGVSYLTTIIDDVNRQADFLAHQFELSQNFPNPFNSVTIISFTIASKSFVSLKVFDVLGREVSFLVSEDLSTGTYSRQWNASSSPSGVYFYRLQAGTYHETKKLVLLR